MSLLQIVQNFQVEPDEPPKVNYGKLRYRPRRCVPKQGGEGTD